jgi:hypothetical protein
LRVVGGVYVLFSWLAGVHLVFFRRERCDVVLEQHVDFSRCVEFSICMLANGKQAFPVCTLMDLENRLFHGRMGPKISDVSQIFIADVHPKWVERVVKPMSKWVAETGYIGWFDVDLAYDVSTDEHFCFEFMVRFSIPSISLAFKLGSCNWLVRWLWRSCVASDSSLSVFRTCSCACREGDLYLRLTFSGSILGRLVLAYSA